jgi:hypothetical protein
MTDLPFIGVAITRSLMASLISVEHIPILENSHDPFPATVITTHPE